MRTRDQDVDDVADVIEDPVVDWRRATRVARGQAEAQLAPAGASLEGRRSPPRRSAPVKPAPTKGAQLIAFPAARRHGEIRKLAAQILRLGPQAAESRLHHQLRIKAEAMLRRGIPGAEVVRQVKLLEASVRAELWRRVMAPNGAG